MLFDEAKPALQLLDVLPCSRDPLLQHMIFSLQESDALAGLQQLGAAVTSSLARRQVLLRLETALPPDAKLILERLEEALQAGERGKVRPCVR